MIQHPYLWWWHHQLHISHGMQIQSMKMTCGASIILWNRGIMELDVCIAHFALLKSETLYLFMD